MQETLEHQPTGAPASTVAAPRPRVDFLDGLRGIAALCVVFCHTTGALFPAVLFGTAKSGSNRFLYGAPFLDLAYQGNFMVCIFYALSGLALSYHTLRSGRRSRAVSGLVRRYPRLMLPVLAGVMVAFVLASWRLFPVREAGMLSHSSWWAVRWHFNPTFWSAFREGRIGVFQRAYSRYDAPLWTIHTELMGSLMVFAVLILCPWRWLRVIVYGFLAWRYLDGYLLAFVGGMAICELWVAFPDRKRAWAPLLIPVGLYGLLLGSYPIPTRTAPRFYASIVPDLFGRTAAHQQQFAHVLGALLVLATVVGYVQIRRPLESAPARFLGRVSFALYIIHFIILGSLGARILISLHVGLPYGLDAAIVFAVEVAASIAAAWLFTVAVDEPVVRSTGWAYRWLAKPFQALYPVHVQAKERRALRRRRQARARAQQSTNEISLVPTSLPTAPMTATGSGAEREDRRVTSPPARSTSDPDTS